MMHEIHAPRRQPKPSGDRGARRRIRLFLLVIFAFVGWALMMVFQQEAVAEEKWRKIEQLEARMVQVQEKNEQLKLEIIRLNDPEYIEQRARADYHMVRDGETLFMEPGGSE